MVRDRDRLRRLASRLRMVEWVDMWPLITDPAATGWIPRVCELPDGQAMWFNLSRWGVRWPGGGCGCIAGHTLALFPDQWTLDHVDPGTLRIRRGDWIGFPEVPAAILGMQVSEAVQLFTPDRLFHSDGNSREPAFSVRPEAAAEVCALVAEGWTPVRAWDSVLGGRVKHG